MQFKMRFLLESNWTILINILLQKYFNDLTTTCILWPRYFDFILKPSLNDSPVFLIIDHENLSASFENNVYDFTEREKQNQQNNVYYGDLIKKLLVAIEFSHCEGFLAFQDDIPKFAEAFLLAGTYSIWRSNYNRFLFAYYKDPTNNKEEYFQHKLFKNQANILVVEAQHYNSTVLDLKTNKFVGSCSDKQQQLIALSKFYAQNNTFSRDINLFSTAKLDNLQGREIIFGAFDFRPFVAVDFQRKPQYYDHAQDNPSHLVHVDGTEIRIFHMFCDYYNCTVQFDTSERTDWGTVYANYTGFGLIGRIADGRIDMAAGAMYAWYPEYVGIDLTTFIGRSGVTCLVPAPTRLTSWSLPIKPFQLTLWLAVFIVLSLESLALLVARKFDQFLKQESRNWWDCIKFGFVSTLKLFISQGTNYNVNSHTVRVVLFACYMIDIIITSIYGGGLAAILTLPILSETADSVEKLHKFNIPWTATSYNWVESISHDDNDSIYTHLLHNYEVNNFDEMREKSKTENMGFVVERLAYGHFGNVDFFNPEALTRLKLMVDDIYNQFTVTLVSRLWAHISKYNEFILAWHSSGFGKYWEWKITANYLNVNEQNQVQASMYVHYEQGPVKLDMKNFAGLIFIWLVGIILSIMGFIAELLWYRAYGRRQQNY